MDEEIRLVLHLQPHAVPAAGHLEDAEGRLRPFCGLLELLHLLDEVRHPATGAR